MKYRMEHGRPYAKRNSVKFACKPKLTGRQRREMIKRCDKGDGSLSTIARSYSVSYQTILRLRTEGP